MDIDYANPSMDLILKASPRMNWRRCWDCEYIGLYRDNVRPACECHECGSADTRVMRKANDQLHRRALPKGSEEGGDA